MKRWAHLTMSLAAMTALLLTASTTAEARVRLRDLKDPGRDYTQRGIQLYAGFGSQGYEIDDNELDAFEQFDDEGLFFLGAAVGLDRNLSLYFEGAGSEHQTPSGDVGFGYGHIGIKYAFQTGHRHLWQPYGKFSLGAVFLVEDERRLRAHHHDGDNGYVGPSIGFAAGIDRFIGRRTALFAEVGVITGEFTERVIDGVEHELDNDIGVTGGRFQFGLRFRL